MIRVVLAALFVSSCVLWMLTPSGVPGGVDALADAEYCDFVSQWKAEEKMGKPEAERGGWPDYNGTYARDCVGDITRSKYEWKLSQQ